MGSYIDDNTVLIKQTIHYLEELPSAKILVISNGAHVGCRIPKDRIVVISNSAKLSAVEELIIDPGTTVFFSKHSKGDQPLYKPEVLNLCVNSPNSFPTYIKIIQDYLRADDIRKRDMESRNIIQVLNELPKEPKPSIQSLTEHTKLPIDKVKENREEYLRNIVIKLNKKLQLLTQETDTPIEGSEIFITDKLTEGQANMIYNDLKKWYKNQLSVVQGKEGWYVKYVVPIIQ